MFATIIRTARLGLIVTILLGLCNLASAQRRLGRSSISATTARVTATTLIRAGRPIVTRTLVVRLPVQPATHGAVTMPIGTSLSNQTSLANPAFSSPTGNEFSSSQTTLTQLLNPVPGLGFDYANLAALNHDLPIRALIDPVTQQELALGERLLQETPATPISFPFFGSELQPAVVLEQQPPQVIVLQQPRSQAQEPSAEISEPVAPPAAEQPPLPDVGEFVLVLHDGTQVHAIAFTRQDDRIVYITPDGLRRSFAVTDLDSAATRRLNDERGTPLRLSL